MQQRGFDVLGQVRIDTGCTMSCRRGSQAKERHTRKWEKYTRRHIAHLKWTLATLRLYGKPQVVRYRSQSLKARFRDGQLVRAV